MTFTPKNWIDSPSTSTPISAAALEDLETRVTDYTDERTSAINVMEYGAAGDGSTDDTTEVQDALDAASAGDVVDFAGNTYALTSQVTIGTANVTLQNGKLLGEDHQTLLVTADDVTVRNMRFERTTPGASDLDSSSEMSNVVVSGERFRSLDCDYTNANLACLLLVAGTAGGAVIRGGRMTNDHPRQNSCGIMAQATGSATTNDDILVDGVTVEGTGCSDGINLYDALRCRVVNCHISGMAELPNLTMTGWTVVSGSVYRVTDRTDGATIFLFNNGVQMTEQTATPTTPASGEYGLSGGYIYANVGGADPDTRTMVSKIVSGYGITVYVVATTSTVKDNLIANNEIHDCDGFGIYIQAGTATSEGNKTSHNVLRNVCTSGVQSVSLPFAGIGVAGGADTTLSGDSIDTVGSVGVHLANSGTGKVQGLDIRDAPGDQGIHAQNGTWQISGCRVRGCAEGYRGSATVTFTDCDADNSISQRYIDGILNVQGPGSPLATTTARIGSIYLRTDGGAATTLYVKQSGTDSSGWAAVTP